MPGGASGAGRATWANTCGADRSGYETHASFGWFKHGFGMAYALPKHGRRSEKSEGRARVRGSYYLSV